MNNLPLISIIIPVYNTDKYLNKCLDSVKNQTYKNLEIYLIDDGSTDNSPKICDDYSKNDKRFIVIHKKNEGQAVARNLALTLIKGEFISFVDSDDYVLPTFIEKLYNAIEKKYDASLCNYLDESITSENVYNELLKDDKVCSQTWAFLYKKELWKDKFFPIGRYAEDFAILPMVLKDAKINVIHEKLYEYYSQNPTNSSNSKKNFYKNAIDRAIAFLDRYNWLKENKYDKEIYELILSKSVGFIIGALGIYKQYPYKEEDIDYVVNFLKNNKKAIFDNKYLSKSRKIAVRIILFSKNLYYILRNFFSF